MSGPRIGQVWRDNDPRENGERNVVVVEIDLRYVYVRNERSPHRRSRILRSRLGSYTEVGEYSPANPDLWPDWLKSALASTTPKGGQDG